MCRGKTTKVGAQAEKVRNDMVREIASNGNRKLERVEESKKVTWRLTIWAADAKLPAVPLSVRTFKRLKDAKDALNAI